MTSARDRFDLQPWTEPSQLGRELARDHRADIAGDEQARNGETLDELPMVGVRRREDVEGANVGLKPRLRDEVDELGRAPLVSPPKLGHQLLLLPTERSTMLLRHIALIHFALALRRQ